MATTEQLQTYFDENALIPIARGTRVAVYARPDTPNGLVIKDIDPAAQGPLTSEDRERLTRNAYLSGKQRLGELAVPFVVLPGLLCAKIQRKILGIMPWFPEKATFDRPIVQQRMPDASALHLQLEEAVEQGDEKRIRALLDHVLELYSSLIPKGAFAFDGNPANYVLGGEEKLFIQNVAAVHCGEEAFKLDRRFLGRQCSAALEEYSRILNPKGRLHFWPVFSRFGGKFTALHAAHAFRSFGRGTGRNRAHAVPNVVMPNLIIGRVGLSSS